MRAFRNVLCVAVFAFSLGMLLMPAGANAALVGHWALDDNAASTTVGSSVNAANNADLTGSVNTQDRHVAGAVGTGAIAFNGNLAAVVSNAGLIQSTLSDYTVSAWIKDYNDTGFQLITSFGSANYGGEGDSRIGLQAHPTSYGSGLGSYATVGASVVSPVATVTGGWHHVVFSQLSGVLKTYLNGVELAPVTGLWGGSNSGRGTPMSTNTRIEIGALAGATLTDQSFSGQIDDVSIFSGQLGDAEVAAICNLGVDALDYDAHNAADLFGIYAGGVGSSGMVGGQTWNYVSGITSGALGQVLDLVPGVPGSDTLILGGGAGNYLGVQITVVPEPSAFALLVCGLLGLLAYAWKRRK